MKEQEREWVEDEVECPNCGNIVHISPSMLREKCDCGFAVSRIHFGEITHEK